MKILRVSLLVLGAVASLVQSAPVVQNPVVPVPAAKKPAAKQAEPVRELAVVANALVVYRKVAALAVVDPKDVVRFFTQETTDNLKNAFASAQSHSAVSQSIIPAIKNLREFVDAAVIELQKSHAKELKKTLKIELKDDRESAVVDFVFKKEVTPGAAKGAKPVVTASVTINGLAQIEPVYFRNLLMAVLLDETFLQKYGLFIGGATGILGAAGLVAVAVVNARKNKKIFDATSQKERDAQKEQERLDRELKLVQERRAQQDSSREVFRTFFDGKSFAHCLAEAMDSTYAASSEATIVKVDEAISQDEASGKNVFVMLTKLEGVTSLLKSLEWESMTHLNRQMPIATVKLDRCLVIPLSLFNRDIQESEFFLDYDWTVLVVDDLAENKAQTERVMRDINSSVLVRFVKPDGGAISAIVKASNSPEERSVDVSTLSFKDLSAQEVADLSERQRLISAVADVLHQEFCQQSVFDCFESKMTSDAPSGEKLVFCRTLADIPENPTDRRGKIYILFDLYLPQDYSSALSEMHLKDYVIFDDFGNFKFSFNVACYRDGELAKTSDGKPFSLRKLPEGVSRIDFAFKSFMERINQVYVSRPPEKKPDPVPPAPWGSFNGGTVVPQGAPLPAPTPAPATPLVPVVPLQPKPTVSTPPAGSAALPKEPLKSALAVVHATPTPAHATPLVLVVPPQPKPAASVLASGPSLPAQVAPPVQPKPSRVIPFAELFNKRLQSLGRNVLVAKEPSDVNAVEPGSIVVFPEDSGFFTSFKEAHTQVLESKNCIAIFLGFDAHRIVMGAEAFCSKFKRLRSKLQGFKQIYVSEVGDDMSLYCSNLKEPIFFEIQGRSDSRYDGLLNALGEAINSFDAQPEAFSGSGSAAAPRPLGASVVPSVPSVVPAPPQPKPVAPTSASGSIPVHPGMLPLLPAAFMPLTSVPPVLQMPGTLGASASVVTVDVAVTAPRRTPTAEAWAPSAPLASEYQPALDVVKALEAVECQNVFVFTQEYLPCVNASLSDSERGRILNTIKDCSIAVIPKSVWQPAESVGYPRISFVEPLEAKRITLIFLDVDANRDDDFTDGCFVRDDILHVMGRDKSGVACHSEFQAIFFHRGMKSFSVMKQGPSYLDNGSVGKGDLYQQLKSRLDVWSSWP